MIVDSAPAPERRDEFFSSVNSPARVAGRLTEAFEKKVSSHSCGYVVALCLPIEGAHSNLLVGVVFGVERDAVCAVDGLVFNAPYIVRGQAGEEGT